jgi:hypothetical protein
MVAPLDVFAVKELNNQLRCLESLLRFRRREGLQRCNLVKELRKKGENIQIESNHPA